ncbi:MAG: type II toxin-antitoxin system VapC family toxin [Rhodanobacteraceae bacterium]|jgi:predicted nucleic acid-binding protein|nr:type II toxin-antitoxin system VapC family toxin [Rhodanobacteraceae bacterium]
MIHFDTNALIALPLWARSGHPALTRIVEGEPCAVCAVVWYEFLAGPVEAEEVRLAHAFIRGAVVPVEAADARLAAMLFNDAGRRRTLKTDALIAATAIRAGAEFFTLNVADFEPFVDHGLHLAESAGI